MIKGVTHSHLAPLWYHSEPSDVRYSENLPRSISWFGLFLQQNDSSNSGCNHLSPNAFSVKIDRNNDVI